MEITVDRTKLFWVAVFAVIVLIAFGAGAGHTDPSDVCAFAYCG
jgi:hypothetical protein